MTKGVRILILEDRAADAELAIRELRKEGLQFAAYRVMTEPDFLAQVRDFPPDLILADYSLPSYDGLSALAAARRECPEAPFIFVSGELGEEKAIEALRHGATDYVLKRRLSRLGGVVRRALQEDQEKRQRQQAEKALREAQGRYRVLFEQSPDGIVIVDPETARFVEFNTAAHQRLGYSREEFAGLSIPDLEAAETPEETMAHIATIVREGRDDFETRFRAKQGDIQHIYVTAQVVDVAGHSVYHCIWRDITERKQAEARIRELNQLLRAIRDINQLIVQERDPSRLLTEACRILAQGLGFPLAWVGLVEPGSKRVVPAAWAGEGADYVETVTVTWDEAPTGRGPVGTAIRSGRPCVCQDTATDPLFAPWREQALAHGLGSVAAVPMVRGGRVLGAVNVYLDRAGAFDAEALDLLNEMAADLALALDDIQLEHERRQAAIRMRLLSQALESAANAIVITDRAGRISWVNPAFTQLTGYSLAEALGQQTSLLKSGVHDPAFYRALWETVLAGKVWSAVMVNRRKDGSRYTEENTITPVHDERGEITHFIAIKQDITARQQAAEAVRQREEYFRALTEKATDVTTVLNADATIRYVSPSMRQVLGYTPEEMLGRIAFDFVHPEDLSGLRQVFSAKVGIPGAAARQEFRFRHKDGTWRALEATARNLLDDASVQGIVVNSRDITERKQAEEALIESNQFNQQIIANAQEGIIVYDRDLRYKVWNPFMERLTGLPAGDVLGKQPAEVFPFLREAGVVASAERTLSGETVPDIELQFSIPATGKMGWVCHTNGALRNGVGQIIGVIGIVRDITERKRAQLRIAAFSQLGQRLSAAKGAKEAAQIIVETADQLLGWDACSVALYSPAQKLLHHVLNWDTIDGRRIEGQAPYDHMPPSPLAKRVIEQGGQLILKEQPEQMTPGGVAFGNAARPSASILFVPVRNGTEVIGVMSIQSYTSRAYNQHSLDTLQALADHCGGALDRITTEETLRTAQQQLRQSQKLEAIGQLAGGVAHDFNNMLAVIGGNAELLLMDADQHTADTKDGLKQILAASQRASNLTRQLLAFSRKQVMQSQSLVLNQVIEDLTKMLRRIIGEHIDLQCHYTDPLPFVQADVGMLEQVLVNLAVNARDAMPQGGQLLITTETVSLDADYVQTHPEARAGESVCLAVADAGTGIAPENLPRIFEPFFTTKDLGKGTGLGLATVYGIVKQHQGWIEVSSQLGAGATFKIFLPAISAPAKRVVASKGEADLSGGSEAILLVEDDYGVRVIIRRVLESHGYKVYEASTGREALELWRSRAEEIALLLTDIVMPQGITGRDLADQLRALRPTLKIIFLSGYSADVLGKDTDFFRRTKSLFIQKPCSTDTLLRTVRRCLDDK